MANNNPNYTVTIQQAADGSVKGSQGITVSAPMPDSFTFDTRSEYQAPYAQGLFGNGAISNLAKLGGLRLTTQALTAQIWQGSTETELGLELEFHAETDPDLEVRQPILSLLRLSTASIDPSTGALKSPGPQVNIDDAGQITADAGNQLANTGKQIGNALISVLRPARLNSENNSFNGRNSSSTPPQVQSGLGGAEYWKNRIRNQISIQIGRYAFFDSVVISNVQKTYGHQIHGPTGLPMYAKVSFQFKPLFLLVQGDLDQIFALGQ